MVQKLNCVITLTKKRKEVSWKDVMLFDMVMTGRVKRQGQHVSRKFSGHKLRL